MSPELIIILIVVGLILAICLDRPSFKSDKRLSNAIDEDLRKETIEKKRAEKEKLDKIREKKKSVTEQVSKSAPEEDTELFTMGSYWYYMSQPIIDTGKVFYPVHRDSTDYPPLNWLYFLEPDSPDIPELYDYFETREHAERVVEMKNRKNKIYDKYRKEIVNKFNEINIS